MLLPAGLVIQHNVHQCLFTSNINLPITSVYCEIRQKQWQRTSDDDTRHKKDGHEHKSTENTLIFVCAAERDLDIQHAAAIGARMQYVPEKEYCGLRLHQNDFKWIQTLDDFQRLNVIFQLIARYRKEAKTRQTHKWFVRIEMHMPFCH